MRTTKFEEKN